MRIGTIRLSSCWETGLGLVFVSFYYLSETSFLGFVFSWSNFLHADVQLWLDEHSCWAGGVVVRWEVKSTADRICH